MNAFFSGLGFQDHFSFFFSGVGVVFFHSLFPKGPGFDLEGREPAAEEVFARLEIALPHGGFTASNSLRAAGLLAIY